MPLLCVPQTQTLSSNAVWHDSRNSTALALALGIPDRQVMYMHVWAPKYSIRLTDRLRADQLTLFGRPPLRDLQHNLGQTSAGLAEIPCTGNLDSVDGIQLSDWRRVSGSVSPATPIGEEFQLVQILDPARKVVGYATLIEEQSDNASGTATSPTRFIGYIAAGTQTDGLTLADRRWVCSPALRRTP